MASRIVFLDVIKDGCIFECGHVPVQVPQPLVNVRVAGTDIAEICLEMLHIDGVKADYGGIEPDISFGDSIPEIEWSRRGSC